MIRNMYRPDIDGLRAVAVLLVVFHHLFPAGLSGGFVGVDVFFVISGFLITTQIAAEMDAGEFSLRRFYQRRINRIVPALCAVVAVTLCSGLLVLSPIDMQLLARSSLFTMMGASNIFFWREYGSYFAQNSLEAPLLHTWSLGVEEQYYIIWPLLIFVIFTYAQRYVLPLMCVMILVSFLVSEIGIKFAASASYYLLPTRFFELLLGSAVALTVAQKKLQWIGRFRYSAHIGLVLIVSSAFMLDSSSAFPGANALVPCLGTALLALTGATARPNANLALRLLTVRAVVALGLVSYSLYLWHWPVIAFVYYKNGPLSGGAVACALVLSLVLSWLSWRFIETPFRRNGLKVSFGRVVAWRYALPSSVVAVFALSTIAAHGFPHRFDDAVTRMEVALDAKPDVLRRGCHSPPILYFTSPDQEHCRLGAPKADIDGVLIGDSYANHFSGMVDVMAKALGVSIIDYTMDSCPPLAGYEVPVNTDKCEKRMKTALDFIKSHNFSKVILAANWPNVEAAGVALGDTVGAIIETGASVTIIANNAYIPQASRCPIKKLMYGIEMDCSVNQPMVAAYIEEIQRTYPGVNVLYPNDIICQSGRCGPVVDNTLLYRDSGHLNDFGSRLLGEKFLAADKRL